jgi:hypothetical protein
VVEHQRISPFITPIVRLPVSYSENPRSGQPARPLEPEGPTVELVGAIEVLHGATKSTPVMPEAMAGSLSRVAAARAAATARWAGP